MKRVIVLVFAFVLLQPLFIALVLAAVAVSPMIFLFMLISRNDAKKKKAVLPGKVVNFQDIAKTEFEKACVGLSTSKDLFPPVFDGMAQVQNQN